MASDRTASLQEPRMCLPVATLSIHPADKKPKNTGLKRSKSRSGLLTRSSRCRESVLSDRDPSISEATLDASGIEKVARSRSTKPILVTLAFTHRIYWKGVTSGRTKTLADFVGCSSLELTRLDDNSTWDDVKNTVKPFEQNNGFGIELPGKLYGLARFKGLRQSGLKRDVKLVLSLNDEELRDNLVQELRARIAPWKLLRQKMKSDATKLDGDLSADEAARKLEALQFARRDDSDSSDEPPSSLIRVLINKSGASASASKESRYDSVDGPKSLPTKVILPGCNEKDEISPGVARDRAQSIAAQSSGSTGFLSMKFSKSKRAKARDTMQHPVLDTAQNTNNHGNISVATATKLRAVADKADHVASTASEIADITSIAGAASSVFQLVVLGARVVAMFAEANRGILELPKALDRVIYLLRHVLRSTVTMITPSADIEEMFEDHVFKVLQGTMDLIGKIEEQYMRGKLSRVIKSNVVREVEKDLDALEQKLPTAVTTGPIAKESIQNVGSVPLVPKLTQLFVGRENQLELLETVLDKYACACISEVAGAGKTEFIAAFANRCDTDKVKGGVYWVNIPDSGEKHEILDALATVAEKLAGKKIIPSDRSKSRIVLKRLACELANKGKDGRWLLCVDGANNANDPDVSEILGELSRMVDPTKGNGWVIITSREGQSSMFDGMNSEQRIELPPLTKDETACVLWRRMYGFKCSEKEDGDIMRDIHRFREENPSAFSSMMRLCEKLEGVPRLIVQAATLLGEFDDLNSRLLYD